LAREVRAIYAGKRKRLVERACRLIQRHIEGGPYAGPLTITALARTLGISVSHLSRTFRKEMGETFERHTMRKRVELAQRLLLDPGQNVAEVAARCGFSDPSYFARVFRKIAGRSPREYAASPLRLRPGV
jgi:two-component system response regulator YesN